MWAHYNVAESLMPMLTPGIGDSPFTLFDIGCSGGLDDAWRRLEPKLRAFGFDPNLAECERLRQQETNPLVRYVPCFLKGATDNKDFFGRNPWGRLAVTESMRIRAERNHPRSLTETNEWELTKLADPNAAIYLPDYIGEQQIDDIDFIKIDVDGPDFEILKSLKDSFDRCGVLAIGMEVNWIGSDRLTEHTFHNTDRYLRSLGFDLLDVSVRKYAMAALPSQYTQHYPARSVSGRPLQGDALYFRDLAASHNAPFTAALEKAKFWRMAAILAIFGKLDELATLVVAFPDQFGDQACTILDELAVNYGGIQGVTSYQDFMSRFRADAPDFYPPEQP